jgi:hypothetical protein
MAGKVWRRRDHAIPLSALPPMAGKVWRRRRGMERIRLGSCEDRQQHFPAFDQALKPSRRAPVGPDLLEIADRHVDGGMKVHVQLRDDFQTMIAQPDDLSTQRNTPPESVTVGCQDHA